MACSTFAVLRIKVSARIARFCNVPAEVVPDRHGEVCKAVSDQARKGTLGTAQTRPIVDVPRWPKACTREREGLPAQGDPRGASQAQTREAHALERGQSRKSLLRKEDERRILHHEEGVRKPDDWRQERDRQSRMAQTSRPAAYAHVAIHQGPVLSQAKVARTAAIGFPVRFGSIAPDRASRHSSSSPESRHVAKLAGLAGTVTKADV
jgi:hypothetical protein